MKTNARYIIGIDPDLHKSGYSVYDRKDKKLTCCTSLFLWDIFSYIEELITSLTSDQYLIRLEYPKSTNSWHGSSKGSALNVGKNQAIAIIIKEFMIDKSVPHELIYPAGYSDFFKNVEFFKKNTGWSERTNEDARASAAMCFGY